MRNRTKIVIVVVIVLLVAVYYSLSTFEISTVDSNPTGRYYELSVYDGQAQIAYVSVILSKQVYRNNALKIANGLLEDGARFAVGIDGFDSKIN
ncbi:MAG: hypothetical protein ABSB40_03995 [Nitrososphaeria archaeon]